jgi:hypothetical protein
MTDVQIKTAKLIIKEYEDLSCQKLIILYRGGYGK